MTDLVEIDFKIPDYLGLFRKSFPRLMITIASDIQTNRALLFDAEGAYNGHSKWKDLASGLNRRLLKNGLQARQILRKSGALKNSLAPEPATGKAGPGGFVKFEGDMRNALVTVGTRLKYARIHNEGGVIQHPGTANGFGRGIKIKPHAIPIHQRNFSDYNRQDVRNLEITLKNTIVEILNGR